MKFGEFLLSSGKLALCSLAFFLGIVLSGQVLPLFGVPAPAIPKGTDAATLSRYFLLASVFLGLSLIVVSRGLKGRFLQRWLTLTIFAWVAYGINASLEASLFSTTSAASPEGAFYNIAGSLISSLLVAAAAFLFPPGEKGDGFIASLGAFFNGRTAWDWAWRLLAALASFPVVYLFFGWLISPIVLKFYVQNAFELTLPEMPAIIAMQFFRSVLFLLAILPILVAWRKTRPALVLSLGVALFFLVGSLTLIVAYWLPPVMRITHGMEILADSLAYALILTHLLVKGSG